MIVFSLLVSVASAQKKNGAYQYHIHQASSAIHIDGVMDEPAWQESEKATDFFMVTPMDTSRAHVSTDVRMTYDSLNIYINVVCWLKNPGTYMVESLRRDFTFGKNDNFSINLRFSLSQYFSDFSM